jgi:hypothetical protein
MCDQNAAPSLIISTFSETDVDTKRTPKQSAPFFLHYAAAVQQTDPRRGPPHGGELRQAAGVAAPSSTVIAVSVPKGLLRGTCALVPLEVPPERVGDDGKRQKDGH